MCYGTQNPSKSLAHRCEFPSQIRGFPGLQPNRAWVEGRIGGRWAGSVIQAVVSLGEAEPGCQRGLFPVLLASAQHTAGTC